MGTLDTIRNAALTLVGHNNRVHRVGVCNASVVESEGRVWVEVGGGGGSNEADGLKLRVTHLHPDNPAIAAAVEQHRTRLGLQSTGDESNPVLLPLDKVSLASQEDYWFNHCEGPGITPKEPGFMTALHHQQTSSQLTYSSIRRSARRCDTCHKKVLLSSTAEPIRTEAPESPVLAHLPSIRRQPLNLPSPSSAVTAANAVDHDKFGEEHSLASRFVGSDEHLSRVQRVLDHEQRTDNTMFASDAVDGATSNSSSAIISSSTDGVDDPTIATLATVDHLTLPTSSATSPWMSKSCPCSPKLNTRRKNYSPDLSPANSHKTVYASSNKFSLSSSLLAIHRQASNSLRGDLFKFDGFHSRSEAGGRASKTSSLQSSIKLRKHKSHCSIDEEDDSIMLTDGEASGDVSVQNTIVKKPIHESHSLPALKLSRMMHTYRGGGAIGGRDDRDNSYLVPEVDSSPHNEYEGGGACALPITQEEPTSEVDVADIHSSSLLPDLIPKPQNYSEHPIATHSVPQIPVAAVSPFIVQTKNGVVNLGFDGHSESSDFVDTVSAAVSNDAASASNTYEVVPQIHGMSGGYLNSGNANVTGFDIPSIRANMYLDSNPPAAGSDNPLQCPTTSFNSTLHFSNSDVSTVSSPSAVQSNVSTAPSTAPCSPSALRIRVMDGKPNTTSDMLSRINSEHKTASGIGSSATSAARPQRNLSQQSRSLIKREDSVSPAFGERDDEQNSGNVSGVLRSQQQLQHPASNRYLQQHQMRTAGDRLEEQQRQQQLAAEEAEFDDERNNNLLEARALVYWWQQENEGSSTAGEEEYCLKQGECGPKLQRPLLLFVHSVGGSADDWHHQLWYFVAAGYEVVAPDLLGHGYSSAPDKASCYRFPRLLEHLRLLYDLFVPRGRKCVLVGHGYGCALVSALSRLRSSSVPMMALAACGGPSPLLPPPPHITNRNNKRNAAKAFFAKTKSENSAAVAAVYDSGIGVKPSINGGSGNSNDHSTMWATSQGGLNFDTNRGLGSTTTTSSRGINQGLGSTNTGINQGLNNRSNTTVSRGIGTDAGMYAGDCSAAAYDPYFGVGSGCCGSASEDINECWEVLCSVGTAAHVGVWSAVKTVLSTTCWLACCLPCVCAKRETVYQARGKQLCSGALRYPGAVSTPAYVLSHVMRGQRWPEGDVSFHRKITVPVLLLHGLKDDTIPLVHMCEMEKTIPRAFLEVLGTCGHHLMTDSPDDVNEALHRFLIRWDRLTAPQNT